MRLGRRVVWSQGERPILTEAFAHANRVPTYNVAR
jgi:hypothetical protein